MRERSAACIGFLVAAGVPALALGLSTPLTTLNGVRNWAATFDMLPVWYGFTVLLAFPIAVPAYLVGRRYRLIRWWSSVITGIVIGAAVSVVIDLHCSSMWSCIKENYLSTVTMSVLGGMASFVFWFIWMAASASENGPIS
jgi:hypothetical protein